MSSTGLFRITAAATAVAGLVALAACGGGSDEVSGIDRGGTPTGVVASGPISGFGSIIVNGVRYNTSGATFTIDDEPGTESDLAVGHVVTIIGEVDDNGNASADSVIFDDNVEGPISAIDLAASRLIVLGQVVLVDAGTSFDDDIQPRSLEGLAVGQIVEVSGLVNADGVIVATRIEREAPGGEFEITGVISGLDTANQRFQIGGLTVDYSGALLEDFPGGQPADGDLVEVKGSNFGAGGELLATEVEHETPGLPGDADDEAEIEGFITRFVSATDFDVAGQPVTTNAQTEFEGGTASDLGLNVKVEAEGQLNASGVLVADKIDIRRDGIIRITANVEDVDTAASTVTLLGIVVTVNNLTRLEDKSDADVEPFRLADINVGDYLEIRGFEEPAGSGAVTATLLEREDPDTEVELRGFVEQVAEPNFVILGVMIVTDGGTVFRDRNGNVITAAQFFSQANGRLAEADGELVGGSLVANEVELED